MSISVYQSVSTYDKNTQIFLSSSPTTSEWLHIIISSSSYHTIVYHKMFHQIIFVLYPQYYIVIFIIIYGIYRHFKHPHLFIHQHPRSLLTLDAREFRSQAVQIRSPFNEILNSSCHALNLHPFQLRSLELLYIVW